jgi:CRP/FNR family transcriptional regulator, cyclic AMP receptor protein
MVQPEYSRVYRIVPLFRALSAEELEEIIGISHLYRVKRGYVVVREGDPSDGMYIVVRGSAQVQMELHQGDQTRLAVLMPGDVFGEISLLDSAPRSATVIMREDGILYRVDAAGFETLRERLSPAAFKVIREIAPIICTRLREINTRVETLFANPQKGMALMERRYMAGAQHARPVDRGAGGPGEDGATR